MLPHLPVIVECLLGVIIVAHSAFALRISSMTWAEYYSGSIDDYTFYEPIGNYVWPEGRRAEQQINGPILPFLM